MRAVLLSDPAVQQALTERYVLCWQSVRPVPKVTIDFGNGQVLERTLKGNTVFYLCRPDGRVLDAFPGVYTPRDFLAELTAAEALVGKSEAQVREWHQARCPQEGTGRLPTTTSKAAIQAPLVRGLGTGGAEPTEAGDSAYQRYVARLLDRSHLPDRVAVPAEGLVARDSRQSVTALRPAVHLLLGTVYAAPPLPAECRLTVFKDMLGVPIDDPFLGLKAAEVPGTP